MQHERFHYKNLDEIKARAEALRVHIPFAENADILTKEVIFGNVTLQNRLGIAPLEGADGLADGSPSELTLRRYLRYARGGAGMIWVEAVAVAPEARNGIKQLMLTEETLENFKRFVERIKGAGLAANGFAPYLVIQAHHSGRYSSPGGNPAPLIAYRHPVCDEGLPVDDDCIVTDDYLKKVEEEFGVFASLAKKAGFDAVDVKACHGYLLTELTSAYQRGGLYGGSFENRTRLLRNAVAASQLHEDRNFLVTARIGIYDGLPWPWGFGVKERGDARPDMEEPIRLVKALYEEDGVSMVNLTVGNPCVYRHMNRPFDMGPYVPDEHPLEGIGRSIRCIGQVKKAVPGMFISASAPSYLRQYAGFFTAGAVEEGLCDHMLFGRMAYADPDFPEQIRTTGMIDPMKTCVACGKCEELICGGKPTGCVVRDAGTYLNYYQELSAVK